MAGMKSALTFLFLTLAFSGTAFAYDIYIPDQTFVVSSGGSSQIKIAVNSTRDDRIIFDLVDESPWMTLSPSQLSIKAGEMKDATLFLSPYPTTSSGLYRVAVSAESAQTREKKSRDIFIAVTRGQGVEIEKIEVSGNLEPAGRASLRFVVKNLGTVSVSDVSLVYTIDSPSKAGTERAETLSLRPEEAVIVEHNYTFAAGAEAGDYAIKARLGQNGKILDAFEQAFAIAKKAVIRQVLDEKTTLFRRDWVVTVTNYGNEADSIDITGRVSFFESYFFEGTLPSSAVNGFYIWRLENIMPGGTRTVRYSLNFSYFYFFIVALALFLWLLLFKMRIVRVRKFIMQKKLIEEGEEFTVGLEAVNKTRRKLENVVITDFVPPVFEVKQGSGPAPSIRKTREGTELSWKINNFHRHEERVFTYRIVPMFGVEGTVRLPRATVTYLWGGKKVDVISGFASIGVEPEEEKEKMHHKLRRHVKKHVDRIRTRRRR